MYYFFETGSLNELETSHLAMLADQPESFRDLSVSAPPACTTMPSFLVGFCEFDLRSLGLNASALLSEPSP